ncbi:hypothetical protein [Synergistes jonesii]|uniref:hypothetical protein n=1 Tax=Synergistes jonesii TaxID=2754 RepID=UPI00248EEAE0|nr:hypothetical protein [Synergistes jonesii]
MGRQYGGVTEPIIALRLYRTIDVDEEAFGELKDRPDFRRPLTSSENYPEGKLIVEFTALIYLPTSRKRWRKRTCYTITSAAGSWMHRILYRPRKGSNPELSPEKYKGRSTVISMLNHCLHHRTAGPV